MERFQEIKQFKENTLPSLDANFYESLDNQDFSDFAKRLGAELESSYELDTGKITLTLNSGDNDSNPYDTSSYTYSITIDLTSGDIETSALPRGFITSKWQEFLFDYYTRIYSKIPASVFNRQ